MSRQENIIFIAGPTATGKSSLAVNLAHSLNGEIVNADALQVYQDLRIISARPTDKEQRGIKHHLFGYLDGTQSCSAGIWARQSGPIIEDIIARQKTALIVGGTGLYFRALLEGLSPIPEIAPHSRLAATEKLEDIGAEAFYEEVIKIDPPMARLAMADRQRLLRAWEVHHATGLPLSHYQNMPRQPVLKIPVSMRIILEPPREELYAQCDNRFVSMIDAGALEEASALLARNLPADKPVMKALGVAELIAHLRGELTLSEAINLAQRNTRRFAKRQLTWFRGQTTDWYKTQNPTQAEQYILAHA